MDPATLATRLAQHVGATRAGADRETYLKSCATEAIDLVTQIVGQREVPKSILERAMVEAGADLYWRQQARNGVATYESEGALETVRVGLDPSRSARAVLAPWLGPVIA
jgi:hypothetical protein